VMMSRLICRFADLQPFNKILIEYSDVNVRNIAHIFYIKRM